VKWNTPERTIESWLWIRYHPDDTCGGGTGGWSQCRQRDARAAIAHYRSQVPD